MGIAKMSRIYLVAHQSEKEAVLNILQQSGMVEISDLQAKDAEPTDWWELVEVEQALPELQELEARLGEVRFAQDFLSRYYPEKKGMLEALSGSKLPVSAKELKEEAAKWAKTARDVYAALRKVDEKLVALRNEETRLQNLKLQLAPWAKLTIPLEELKSTTTVRLEPGVLPAGELAKAREELLAAVPSCYLHEVDGSSSEAYVVVACYHRDIEQVQAILKQHNFNRHNFGDLTKTVAENMRLADEGLARVEKERQEALKMAGEQVEHREHLNYYFDYLTMEKEKAQVTASFARTANSFVLEGWVRTADLPRLEKLLAECETVELMSHEPGEEEDFPVMLENHRAVAPFEFITKLYGTPHSRGIDPTLALAPFFVMFFGLCMTDAGYGTVLALVAALALWKLKPSGAFKNLLWIMVAGGLSTVLFGQLVGGWFGASAFGSPWFFDAMAEPMTMLIYSLALGTIQIFVGMGIKMYMNIKAGKWQEVIYDDLLWYTIMIGILLFGLVPAAKEAGKWMTIIGAVGLTLTQGRSHTNIIKRFFSGLLSLYNLTGWLSDVLSYSRLLALGLATGVIALAVNTMAGLLSGSILLLPLKFILLFIGHSFNLVINALGSFVHSCRLQYIEYYGRFYEAGGRAFAPFELKTRYVQVMPEWTEES